MKNANYIKYCKNCVIPETRPNTEIDSSGFCTGCKFYFYREKINWKQRNHELIKIIETYKSKFKNNYDCVVPSSGGKDSTYQVLKVLELGLKPLIVTIIPDMLTPLGRKNIDNIKNFGVDYIEFTSNKLLRKKINKFTLETVGDLTWAEEVSISCATVRIASRMKIPLIIWGENSENENGGPEKNADFFDDIIQKHDQEWFEEFGGTNGLRSSDLLNIWENEGITQTDLLPYTFPSKDELSESNIHGIFLGHYIPWDGEANAKIAKKNGFTFYDKVVEGNIVEYENLDNYQMRIHDYFKFLKYGYDRVSDWGSLAIRRGRITREKAIEFSREIGGKYPKDYLGKNIKDILKYIDVDENEFKIICEKFTNKKLFKKNSDGTLLYDNNGNLIKINYDNNQ